MEGASSSGAASGKIRQVEELSAELALRKSRGETVVFTNGCYDILHVGHVRFLERCRQLGQVGEHCMEWQIPLVAMMYTRGPKITNEYDVANVKLAARVGAELGADIVKVVYTGRPETFSQVVVGCPVPVVIAGGPKMASDEDIFRMVEGALKAGASGVSIGRNAFQHKTPDRMVRALCRMAHEGAAHAECAGMRP